MYKKLQRIVPVTILLCCLIGTGFSMAGCRKRNSASEMDKTMQAGMEAGQHPVQQENIGAFELTDSAGNKAVLTKESRIVSLYGSYAECWILAGGQLVGVTQDAIDERKLELADTVQIVGTVKDPNLEMIVSLNPDYVILSKDLTAHEGLKQSFDQLGIGYGYFTMDTFADYALMMEQFCQVNDRMDLYEVNVTEIEIKIDEVLMHVKQQLNEENPPKVLLMRAYTTGVKAKTDDNLAGVILKEFGCDNIADHYPSMLEDLSVEQIIEENPDYILVLTMGDEKKALAYLEQNVISNPAWNQLSAVINDRYVILPKELFHYKPNNRWGESYAYLFNILFPQQSK